MAQVSDGEERSESANGSSAGAGSFGPGERGDQATPGETKVSTIPGQLDTINARITAAEQRMSQIEHAMHDTAERDGRWKKYMERDLRANNVMTTQIKNDTTDIVLWATRFNGALQVAELVGKLLKPLLALVGIGASIGLAWAAFKTKLFGL